MNEENRNTIKSAEVIGEGTYGCIHKPSLKCKNKKANHNKKVSKLLLKENAEKEVHEYDILSKIDKKHEYYLGNPITCLPAETEFNKKSMEKCETFVEENNNNNNFIIRRVKRSRPGNISRKGRKGRKNRKSRKSRH